MTDIAISVRNVSKCYRVFDDQRSRLLNTLWPTHSKGLHEVWALKDISFEIRRGEAVAIIGRNGGGKSTLLEILTGTLMPTTGDVTVNGRVSALLELGSGFNPEYSGRENVILNGLLLGLRRDDIVGRFAEIEAFAEIGAAIERPVKTYSSGMVMRLAFAVQVLCDPDILIIDEALSVGDFFFQQKCLSHIRSLCAKGTTLLFVSHDMGAVRDICERGIFLRKGLVGFDGGKLEAIRQYLLTAGSPTSNSADVSMHAPSIGGAEVTSDANEGKLFWVAEANDLQKNSMRIAHIVSLSILDEEGMPISFCMIGANIVIKVKYISCSEQQLHGHIVIKNKYDQVITSFGSHNKQLQSPSVKHGEDAWYIFKMQMSLEAGDYIFCFSLARPSEDSISGEVIDSTPWLGPFRIDWDYEKNIPPFYGMVGINYSVSSSSPIEPNTD